VVRFVVSLERVIKELSSVLFLLFGIAPKSKQKRLGKTIPFPLCHIAKIPSKAGQASLQEF
jgi:hypothetical protein